MPESGLHQRLRAAAGDRTYRAIGELTGAHPENVRRYMTVQSPSAEFLASFCRALDISADWLFTGDGPMRIPEEDKQARKRIETESILGRLAERIENLVERTGRIEVHLHTLEARLDAAIHAWPPPAAGRDAHQGGPHDPHSQGQADRSGRVADALARRSPPDAR